MPGMREGLPGHVVPPDWRGGFREKACLFVPACLFVRARAGGMAEKPVGLCQAAMKVAGQHESRGCSDRMTVYS